MIAEPIIAGELDRRILIERDFPSRDGHGNDVHNWQTFASVWAGFMPGTGTERRQAAADRGALAATFRVRKTSTLWTAVGTRVDPNCRIVFQGIAWDIHSIALFGRDGLDITATTAYEIVVRPLSGAASAIALVSGDINIAALLAGAAVARAAAAGDVTIAVALQGAAAARADPSGSLTVLSALAGSAVAVGTVSGAVTVSVPLAGAAAANAASAGDVTVTANLAGGAVGVGAAAGAVTVTVPLAGGAAAKCTAAGDVTVVASFGPEMVIDGTNFATGYTNIRNTNVSGGTLNAVGGTGPLANLALTGDTVVGSTYLLAYDVVSYSAGIGCHPAFNAPGATTRTAVGHYEELITVTTATTGAVMAVSFQSSTIMSVDNISLKLKL